MRGLFILAILLVCFSGPVQAQLEHGGDHIVKVLDLPETEDFRLQKLGGSVDLGYRYKRVRFMWIPLWNYDEGYCLFREGGESYLSLTETEAKECAEKAEMSLPTGSPIPGWDRLGGKLVVLLLVALYFVVKAVKGEAWMAQRSQTADSFGNNAMPKWLAYPLIGALGLIVLLLVVGMILAARN